MEKNTLSHGGVKGRNNYWKSKETAVAMHGLTVGLSGWAYYFLCWLASVTRNWHGVGGGCQKI